MDWIRQMSIFPGIVLTVWEFGSKPRRQEFEIRAKPLGGRRREGRNKKNNKAEKRRRKRDTGKDIFFSQIANENM